MEARTLWLLLSDAYGKAGDSHAAQVSCTAGWLGLRKTAALPTHLCIDSDRSRWRPARLVTAAFRHEDEQGAERDGCLPSVTTHMSLAPALLCLLGSSLPFTCPSVRLPISPHVRLLQAFLIRYLSTFEAEAAAGSLSAPALEEAKAHAKEAALGYIRAPALSQRSALAHLAVVSRSRSCRSLGCCARCCAKLCTAELRAVCSSVVSCFLRC